MQPIERYGLVALLFVFVTVVGVVSWDFSDTETDGTVQAAEKKTPASRRGREPEQDPEDARMSLKTRPRAIQRESLTIDEPGPNRSPERFADTRRGPRREERQESAGSSPRLDAAADRDRSGRPIELRRDTEAGLVARGTESSQPDSAARFSAPPPSAAIEPGVELRPRPPRAGSRQAVPGRSAAGDAAGTPGVYVVKGGDTLSEISLSQLGTSKRWKEIVAANPGLDPGKLRVGARLKLPAGGLVAGNSAPVGNASSDTGNPASRPANAEAGETVRVRSGDSLWKIAARALGDGERWKEIAALNPRIDPDRLAVGQEIVLPRGARALRIVDSSTAPDNASRGSRTKQGVVN